MTARVVKIGKHSWVAGLSWRSFEDVPSKDELREDAEQLKASWVAVRIGESSIQGGFCAPIEGVKNPASLSSLAAYMADSRREPWLGIFKIEEGIWWYIAVRDGHAILLDGDVIGGEKEILAARERHSGYEDWQYIEGGMDLLQELLAEIDAKRSRLKSLEGTNFAPIVAMAAAAVAAVGLVGGGAYWWHAKKQAEELAQQEAIQKFRAQLASKAKAAPAANAPAMPAPADWLRACHQIISPLPLSRQGWLVDQVGCDMSSAVVLWKRGEGATVATRPPGDVSEDGNSDQERIALPAVKARDASDAVELQNAKMAARAWAQVGNYALTFAAPVQPPRLPGAPGPAAIPVNQVGVAIDMAVSPFRAEIADQLTKLPGLRLQQMKSTDAGWHLEGVIYGR